MTKNKFIKWIKTDAVYFNSIALLLYSILFVIFYNKFLYSFGPDFVSYYAIAKQYAAGDFNAAVNSWWSPMYSWLLAICLKFQLDPLVANKLVQFIAGWYGFLVAKSLLQFFCKIVPSKWLAIGSISYLPFLVVWVLKSDTPDLISAVLLLHFLYYLLKLVEKFATATAIIAGILGGLAYWAKAYNFYFVIIFSLAVLLYYLVVNKARFVVLKHFSVVAMAFIAASFIWVCILWSKTNQVQVSSIGIHKLCTGALLYNSQQPIQPYDCAGLGLDATAMISNWEHPNLFPTQHITATLGSRSNLGMEKLLENGKSFFTKYISLYQLLFLMVCFAFYFSWFKRYAFLVASFFIVYVIGYFLLHIEVRFFIPLFFLLMILCLASLLQLVQHYKRQKYFTVCILFCAILFGKTPLQQMLYDDMDTLPRAMHNFVAQQQTVESVNNIAATSGSYEAGLYYCFFTKNKFYGTLTEDVNALASKMTLQQNQINTIITQDSTGKIILIPFPDLKLTNTR